MSTVLGLSIGQALLTSFPAAVGALSSEVSFTPTDVKVVGTFLGVLKDQRIIDPAVALSYARHLEDKVLRQGKIELAKEELSNLLQGAHPNLSEDIYNNVAQETRRRLKSEGISLFDETSEMRDKIKAALAKKAALDRAIIDDFEGAMKAIETAAAPNLFGTAKLKALTEVGPADQKVVAYVRSHPELFESQHIKLLREASRRNKDFDYALGKLEGVRPELFE